MPVPGAPGGKMSPSPSSRVNKESSPMKGKRSARADWKCHTPLTSEMLDGSKPSEEWKKAKAERQAGSTKIGPM